MTVAIRETATFKAWIANLRDDRARGRINIRIRRLSLGNFGDAKSLGGGLSELRIDYGPGYRVYFCQRGGSVVILLCGGDQRTQDRDVAAARRLAEGE